MAERRMFAKTIVFKDEFINMRKGAKCLYYAFGMNADDDGFVNSPQSIVRQHKISKRDFKLLVKNNLIIPFDSGVIVITHWKQHNYIQKDRYKPTNFQKEKEMLGVTDDGVYFLKNEHVYIKNGNVYMKSDDVYIKKGHVSKMDTSAEIMYPQVKVKDSINNIYTIGKSAFGPFENVFLTSEEYEQLKERFPKKYDKLIEKFSAGLETYGYKYDNHFAAILLWEENDRNRNVSKRRRWKNKKSELDVSWFDDPANYMVPDLSKKGEN